ncbi:allantoinase [Paenibacillus protaetiae]|uniref:Allantoinase n=1 Tax=Paenibacillus protaetiae TaxID=2509456 RepID=A0A4V0YEX4_9BACL|nr:allantoinase [Paenibacillus protaetiae]QAY65721.1 allantoinase [Paenibacillus protaetiae]
MALDLIIRGGSVVLANEVRKADIGVRDGRIAVLADSLQDEACITCIDAEGKLVFPGMVDIHVHFNEPNFGHWEGFATGSAALAAGGCTTYVDMPLNGNPPTVDAEALRMKLDLAKGQSSVDYTVWGGLVPGHLNRLEELAAEGVRGFKAFMSNPGGEGEGRFREADDWTLYAGMKRIKELGGFVALHAESDSITSRLAGEAVAAGRTDAGAFAASRPVIAELEAVNKALLFAEETGCQVHFVHISSPAAIRLIDQAKRRGVPVTAETCPHYLVLTEQDMADKGPVAKCAPPLRSKDAQEELWTLLAEGKLDVIASDHSPCPPELKLDGRLTFFEAWGGISGAQSSLELMLDEGWLKRGIPLPLLARLLSTGPAKRFGLHPRKGEITLGADADFAIVDTDEPYVLTEEQLYYRHKMSPYAGRQFNCKVTATYVRGKLVYSADAGIVAPGSGQLLLQPVKVG